MQDVVQAMQAKSEHAKALDKLAADASKVISSSERVSHLSISAKDQKIAQENLGEEKKLAEVLKVMQGVAKGQLAEEARLVRDTMSAVVEKSKAVEKQAEAALSGVPLSSSQTETETDVGSVIPPHTLAKQAEKSKPKKKKVIASVPTLIKGVVGGEKKNKKMNKKEDKMVMMKETEKDKEELKVEAEKAVKNLSEKQREKEVVERKQSTASAHKQKEAKRKKVVEKRTILEEPRKKNETQTEKREEKQSEQPRRQKETEAEQTPKLLSGSLTQSTASQQTHTDAETQPSGSSPSDVSLEENALSSVSADTAALLASAEDQEQAVNFLDEESEDESSLAAPSSSSSSAESSGLEDSE
uniref:Uncharacterized protein n=1 Tax=Chromera velia CCMP2878 TaxID=1169474 RepID=A0A0G4GDM9_9ALVE|eukprot:Cvel_640.t1-p1 / transcript=Cvel_640.t1 / gene=Cvel_640 / organism=Chromera_velia_CCMP2878 / gene_product=hypothetical protein / transcript_product=hypothetical protein / location=Cvel_scaffold19:170724-171791(+) / protein_length=356 / sequence_SO=supercontig / SO=protein_coding / is_pseudo=false